MAPFIPPTALSSNWKALQKSLLPPGSASPSTPGKRKAGASEQEGSSAAGEGGGSEPRRRKRIKVEKRDDGTEVSQPQVPIKKPLRTTSKSTGTVKERVAQSAVSKIKAKGKTAVTSSTTPQTTTKKTKRTSISVSKSPSLNNAVQSSAKKKRKRMSTASGDETDDFVDDNDAETVTKSLQKFAEENDISAEDLAKAYGALGRVLGNKQKLVDGKSNGTTNGVIDEFRDISEKQKTTLGKYLAIDCEMIAVDGRHPNDPIHERSVLARVSLVNYHGHPLLDLYVLPPPTSTVSDWRTQISGIRPSDMSRAVPFAVAQAQVAALLKNRILVGHALKNDLDVLMLSHPRRDIRDTSRLERFRMEYAKGRTPSLKVLAKEILGVEVQSGEHSSVEDARVAMAVYRRCKKEFEEEWTRRWPGAKRGTGAAVAKATVEVVDGKVVLVQEVGGGVEGGLEDGGTEGKGEREGGAKKRKKKKNKGKKKKGKNR